MIGAEDNKVYLALGMSDSIGDLVTRTPGQRPALMSTTLLPWAGRLVYDGIVKVPSTGRPPATDKRLIKRLEATYRAAVLSGEITVSVSKAEMAAADPGGPEEEDEGLEEDDEELTAELLRVQALMAAADVDPDNSIVYRRFGYTPAENPNHMCGALVCTNAGGTIFPPGIPPMFQMRAFNPTVEELLDHLEGFPRAGLKIPANVATDHHPILRRLKQVLAGSGIDVCYYPPPSEQEQELYAGGGIRFAT